MSARCKRRSGTERAWFLTREEAEAFAQDPLNPSYRGDMPDFCSNCQGWHLSPAPQGFTHGDFEMLASMGIEVPATVPGETQCALCGVVFREGVDFLILPDGNTVCPNACDSESR